MRTTLIGAGLCLLLALLLWQRQAPQDPLVRRELFSMGTLVQISILPPAGQAGAETDALVNRITRDLQSFHQRWAPTGEGELGRLNDALAGAPAATIPVALRDDLDAAGALCRRSGGRFDPAIGALVRLWGFDDEAHFRSTPPDQAVLAAVLAAGHSLCSARIENGTIHFDTAGAVLDFGAAAKGRGVGLAIGALRAAGVRSAIVNAGGDLQVLGDRGDRPWRIGIRHPRPTAAQPVLATLNLADGEAVFTSGDYERYFEHAGQRYHHLLDPGTGQPAGGMSSATVVSTDPWLADAASTALFVAGPEAGDEVMMAMGIRHYLWVATSGERHVSPALAARLKWSDEPG